MSRDPATESRLLAGILALLVLYTLYFASSILFPITLAILLSLLLAPVVRALTVVHVPRAASAAVVLRLFPSAVGGAGFMLAEPAGEWANKAPQFLRQAEIKLRSIKQPIEEVKKATDQIEELAGLDESGGGMVVGVEPIGLVSSVLAGAPAIAAGSVVTLILIAVPLLTSVKVCCEQVPSLAPVALLVGIGDAILNAYEYKPHVEVMRADPIRIVEAIITGIGFLGAGTIFRGKGKAVEGLTTAASMWFSGGVGMAVAFQQSIADTGRA